MINSYPLKVTILSYNAFMKIRDLTIQPTIAVYAQQLPVYFIPPSFFQNIFVWIQRYQFSGNPCPLTMNCPPLETPVASFSAQLSAAEKIHDFASTVIEMNVPNEWLELEMDVDPYSNEWKLRLLHIKCSDIGGLVRAVSKLNL